MTFLALPSPVFMKASIEPSEFVPALAMSGLARFFGGYSSSVRLSRRTAFSLGAKRFVGYWVVPSPSSSVADAYARLADTFSAPNRSVFLRVFMAMLAMGSGALLCGPSLRPHNSAARISASNVFGPCNRLQVFGVGTASDATEMVQAQSIRNFSNVQFVAQHMGLAFSLEIVNHNAVAMTGSAGEKPAPAVRLGTNLLQQSFHSGTVAPLILPPATTGGNEFRHKGLSRLPLQHSTPNHSEIVLQRRDNFQVGGIYATTHAARMVYPRAIRDRADMQLVRDEMGRSYASVRIGKSSVTFRRACGPEPASRIRVNEYLFAKAISEGSFNMVFSHLDLLKSFGQGCAGAANTFVARSYFTPIQAGKA